MAVLRMARLSAGLLFTLRLCAAFVARPAPQHRRAAAPGSAAVDAAIEALERKHDAAYARGAQTFRTWHADGEAAEDVVALPVDVTRHAFPENADGAPPPRRFADGPCAAVTAAPLFSADECGWLVAEAERAGRWVKQEFRYARDVVQQVEDLPEGRQWLEAACRQSLFPLLQHCFPGAVGAGAAARDALRVFDAKILKYNASAGQSYLGAHRDGTLLTAVVALNPLDAYAGGGTHVEPLGRTLRYDVGHVCCHAGEVRHAGAEVESGVRYALVCFVDSAAVFEPARALSNEGDARRLRGDLDDALRLYDHAIAAGPSNELPHCGRGQVLLERRDFAAAAAAYAEAVDLAPRHAVAWTNLGCALAKAAGGDAAVLREAVAALETAAALDAREPAPLNNLGLLLGDLKIHDAARDVFAEAVDRATAGGVLNVAPRELADYHCNLGVELVELGNLRDALRNFEDALACDPSHPGAAGNIVAMRTALRS